MNCPKCMKPITTPGRYCAGCGHDYGEEFNARLSLYFALQKEVGRLGSVRTELSSGLASIESRINEFEGLLKRDLERSAGIVPAAAEPALTSAEPETVKQERVAPGPMLKQTIKPKRDSSEFEVRMGQKWLLIIGILTMVFGVGYFLKYSFEQGWVGPAGRVALAYVWGIVFLVAGDWFRRKDLEKFGLPLIGGGIAVLYFSTFAAFQIYQLFDQTLSFSVMVLITMLACTLAIRYDTKWLAVMGLIGGFLTPVLLTTGQDNQIALMTYMTILNLGLLGIAFYKKWDLLNTLGLAFTYLLYTAWFAQHYQTAKFWPAILFLNVFYLIYTFVPFTYQVRKGEGSAGREIALMGINAFIAFAYGYFMIRELYGVPWVSIITIFYAAVSLSMASYLFQKGKQTLDVFVMMLAMAMLFLIITVPVLFSKHWITIFWSAQSIGLLWMAVKLERRSLTAGAYALLAFAAGKFLFYDYEVVFHFRLSHAFTIEGGYTYLIIERYVTTTLVLSSLYLAVMLAKQSPMNVLGSKRGDSAVCGLIFGVVLFITLTAEVSTFFYDYLPQARFAAISVLWTLFSVALMRMGFRRNIATLRKTSIGLFLVVVLKVFLFDMANVSTPYRIISFIVLGLVLVSTSYLYYRHKDRIINALSDADKKDR